MPEPTPELPTPEPASPELEEPEALFEGFHSDYNQLISSIPPSVRRSLLERLTRKRFDPSTLDDGEAVRATIESTVAAYQRKKERGRIRAAEKRAARKAAKAAAKAAEDDEVKV